MDSELGCSSLRRQCCRPCYLPGSAIVAQGEKGFVRTAAWSLQFNGALYVCAPGMLHTSQDCGVGRRGGGCSLLEQMKSLKPREGVEGPPVDASSLYLSPLPENMKLAQSEKSCLKAQGEL